MICPNGISFENHCMRNKTMQLGYYSELARFEIKLSQVRENREKKRKTTKALREFSTGWSIKKRKRCHYKKK